MGKDYLKKRISIYAGTDIDPNIDSQVVKILRNKFNIALPQRSSLDDALSDATSSHEIIELIIKYRSMNDVE